MADLQAPDIQLTQAQDAQIQGDEADVSSAKSYLDQEREQLASDRAGFNPTGPEGTGGPQPTFNQPTPQDHMQDIMKIAPIWMALGAIGGRFTKQSGLTMLSSTNGMMKGLVQGNEQAYGEAREKYDKDYAEFRDKQKTWMDVYRAYMVAYKGRVDADIRAVAGANTAVGIADKALRDAHLDVAKQVQLSQQAANLNSLITHRSNEDVQSAIRTQIARDKAAQTAGVKPDSQEAELLADLTDLGVSLPQGLRSKGVLASLLGGLIKRHPDETMDQIAQGVKSGQIDMRVGLTEATRMSQREAQILPVEKSITQPGGFLDQAEKAVNDVNFSDVKRLGQLERLKASEISDPKLSAYVARVTELRQEYAIVLSKGGMTTDKAREESAAVVPDQITPAQFKEIRAAITQGIATAKKGVRESIDETSGRPVTPPKYAYGEDGKPAYVLIDGNWVPLAKH